MKEIVTPAKAVFNWSGGKDSALALYKALQTGDYDIVALLTTINSDTQRSSMHAIPVSLLQTQAESIGIPLYLVDLASGGEMAGYEEAMQRAVEHFRQQGVVSFIFGDIYLHDIRKYREEKLRPYGIEVVEPLWDRTPREIMDDFLESGLKTVVVATTADKLGREFVGRCIDRSFVEDLPADVDICGENGEYHTFCFDGPVFRSPIDFTLGETYLLSHEIGLEDGGTQVYNYWYTTLNT